MINAKGVMPFGGRVPANAEWRLLLALVEDLSPYIDKNDVKLIKDIAEKRDVQRYFELGDYWGLRSIDPVANSSTHTRDASLYLLCSFLSKFQFENRDLESVTMATFLQFERNCFEYNREGYRQFTWSDDVQVQAWRSRFMGFIREVIGDYPAFDKIAKNVRHGKGRTVSLNAKYGHRFYKYNRFPYDVTADCLPHARRVIRSDERWVRALEEAFDKPFHGITDDQLFRVVPGNLVLFVPKNAKTLRTIACEPTMNVNVQLGVDGFIRERLLKFGVNINDQSLNQRMAKEGSLTGALATYDLKGASELVTRALIDKNFPPEWVCLLDELRSPLGQLPDGSTIRYEKISSMGNGYTFALETLIFAAAVHAVGGKLGVDSHVYGDDIILPTDLGPDLVKLLNLMGFLINTDKSFFEPTGVRESCGTDYRNGLDIRPVFMKVPLTSSDNTIFAVYTLHNKIMKWWDTHIGDPICPGACQLLQRWVPQQYHCFGPPNADELSSYFASRVEGRRTDFYGFIHDAVVAKPKTHEIPESAWYFALLLHDLKDCASDSGTKFSVTQRGVYSAIVKRDSRRAFAWPKHF